MTGKRILVFILTSMLAVSGFLTGVRAAAPPSPTDSFYVNDYAGVIDDAVEEKIIEYGNRLFTLNGAQVVLVTMDFTDDRPLGEYAKEMFNSWGIGSADKDNGVLILLSIGGDDYYALQGKGLEGTLTDGIIDQMLYESLEPDFAAQNYSAGADKIYGAFVRRLGGQWPDTNEPAAATKYVRDEAGVLSASTVSEINRDSAQYAASHGMAVFVATVQDTGGQRIDAYAESLFGGDGPGTTDVLLLFSVGGDDYYALSGEGAGNVFTDSALSDILYRTLEPLFAAQKYDEGAAATVRAFYRLIDARPSAGLGAGTPQPYASPAYPPYSYAGNGGGDAIFLLLFLLIVLIVLLSLFGGRRRYYRRRWGVPFNPYAPRYIRRYGPGGYWGRYGRPMHMPPPPMRGFGMPPPPMRGFGGMPPPSPPGGSPGGAPHAGSAGRSSSSGGSFWGGSGKSGSSGSSSGGGGISRGGGAGRSSGSFGGGGSRGGGSFGGGGSRGGGGMSRGGGGGRR